MSSTLASALVARDQALVRHLGDSAVWLYSPTRQIFTKLTNDHSACQEKDFSLESDAQDAALTRVVGACQFSEPDNAFLPQQQQAESLRVQLRPGDLLLVASDGLVDGIDQPTEQDKTDLLAQAVEALVAKNTPLPQLVRHLVSLAEDGLSCDNITLVGVKVLNEEKDSCLKKSS